MCLVELPTAFYAFVTSRHEVRSWNLPHVVTAR
jgi:hypothetical protein